MSYRPFDKAADTWVKNRRQLVVGADTARLVLDQIDGSQAIRIYSEFRIVNSVPAVTCDWFIQPNGVNLVLPTQTWFQGGGSGGSTYTKPNGQLAGNGSGGSRILTGWFWLDLLVNPEGTGFSFPRKFVSRTTYGANLSPAPADVGINKSNGSWTDLVTPLASVDVVCSAAGVPTDLRTGIGQGSTFEVYLLALP